MLTTEKASTAVALITSMQSASRANMAIALATVAIVASAGSLGIIWHIHKRAEAALDGLRNVMKPGGWE